MMISHFYFCTMDQPFRYLTRLSVMVRKFIPTKKNIYSKSTHFSPYKSGVEIILFCNLLIPFKNTAEKKNFFFSPKHFKRS